MPPDHDPSEILAALCRRHGLEPEQGTSLLPLVQRALAARDAVRRQALRLVDQTLARKAAEQGEGPAADQQEV